MIIFNFSSNPFTESFRTRTPPTIAGMMTVAFSVSSLLTTLPSFGIVGAQWWSVGYKCCPVRSPFIPLHLNSLCKYPPPPHPIYKPGIPSQLLSITPHSHNVSFECPKPSVAFATFFAVSAASRSLRLRCGPRR